MADASNIINSRTANGDVHVGRQFSSWTVIAPAEPDRFRKTRWMCRCECGKQRAVQQSHLRRGVSVSCGCSRRQPISHGATTGGVSAEYKSWRAMRSRCSTGHYVSRGIAVCDRWGSFEAFLADMGPKPDPTYSIDRIDNLQGYEPGNCRWATQSQQTRNFSRNHLITANGETMPLAAWAESTGISSGTILGRIRAGWGAEKAVSTPVRTPSSAPTRAS